MSNATGSPTVALGPLSLVPLLVSTGTLVLVVVMMFYVCHNREVRKSVQFSKQLRVTEERIENLEARKVTKLALRNLQAVEKGINLREMDELRPVELHKAAGSLDVMRNHSTNPFKESAEQVGRHTVTTEFEDVYMSTAAECGTTCSSSSLGNLCAESDGGRWDRWNRQRQGPTAIPLPSTGTVTQEVAVRSGEVTKRRVETSPQRAENGVAAHIVPATEVLIPSVKVATALSLNDGHEKWV